MADETSLAKAEAVKRFRSAVRLEFSLAGDYVIGRHLDEIRRRAEEEIARGGIPALEAGMGSLARQIADKLQPAFEAAVAKALTEGGE